MRARPRDVAAIAEMLRGWLAAGDATVCPVVASYLQHRPPLEEVVEHQMTCTQCIAFAGFALLHPIDGVPAPLPSTGIVVRGPTATGLPGLQYIGGGPRPGAAN